MYLSKQINHAIQSSSKTKLYLNQKKKNQMVAGENQQLLKGVISFTKLCRTVYKGSVGTEGRFIDKDRILVEALFLKLHVDVITDLLFMHVILFS